MSFVKHPVRKRVQIMRLNFEKTSIEFPFDSWVRDFFAQVEPGTAKPEDIHVAFSAFQIYWPFKTFKDRVTKVETNYPQNYCGYYVRDDYRNSS